MRNASRSRQVESGFTLTEMTVVLAIIGLLLGAVVSGQYLVARARLNTIVSDFAKFKTAYQNFVVQYKAMPGDMLDATEYWGTDPNGCNTNSVYTPRQETCNGNGNGSIMAYADTTPTTAYELFRAWQHLSDAGYITGSFSGVAGSGGSLHATPNENSPAGPIPNTAYSLHTIGTLAVAGTNHYVGTYGTVLEFGQPNQGSGVNPRNAVFAALTPKQAYQIDSKIDDGKPATGNLMTYRYGSSYNSGCANSTDTAYNLTNGLIQCSFLFSIAK